MYEKIPETQKGVYSAGIYLKMKEGWKTYWRIPGDSGVPPHFNWSGSSNIKNVEVLWPAPQKFVDPYGISIGYDSEILFPAKIEPIDSSKPILLNVTFDYGVCKDICVPEQAKLNIKFDKHSITTRKDKQLIKQYMASVPKQVQFSDEKNANQKLLPAINNISAKLEGKTPHILIEALFRKGAKTADIFVETSDNFYLAWPKQVGKSPAESKRELITYRIDLKKNSNLNKLKGQNLIMTLVSEKTQSEVYWKVP
ncbi:MAG: protein-disulfide reductase DsbD domain-containing protein [Pseudomonadota bacterium]